jgi:hypothetical protein
MPLSCGPKPAPAPGPTAWQEAQVKLKNKALPATASPAAQAGGSWHARTRAIQTRLLIGDAARKRAELCLPESMLDLHSRNGVFCNYKLTIYLTRLAASSLLHADLALASIDQRMDARKPDARESKDEKNS